jgi:hypothetical protein
MRYKFRVFWTILFAKYSGVDILMRNLLTCACLLLLAFPAVAQKADKSKTSVIWSADPTCHQSNSEEVKALKPQCSAVKVDNLTFYIINYGGISYAMSHRPVRDYLVASVQISNKTDVPMQMNPNRSRLGLYKSIDDYNSNAKPELFAAQSQDALRQADYRESTVIGERDGDIRSGLQLRDKFERNVERGKVIQRTNRDEAAPPPTEDATPASVTSSLLIPRSVFDYILKTKSIPPGEKTAGHLVFKNRDEQTGYRVFFLNAGSVEFVFPVAAK